MYLLYLDDAGSVGSKTEKHFMLAGICVFERQTHFLSRGLDALAERICPSDPDALEFHGSHMLPGKGFWRSIREKKTRRAHIRHALAECTRIQGKWALFGAVVEKSSISPDDAIDYAFEQVCTRFDAFLRRQHYAGNTQRGLNILDKSTRETRLQGLAAEFKNTGHRYGVLRNMSDVPLFVDSKATRLIQYADLVSYALWQKFEKGDSEFFDVIKDKFDNEGGVVHGLMHQTDDRTTCDCPYCDTRGSKT